MTDIITQADIIRRTAIEFYERHQWHDLEEGDLELDIGTRYLCVVGQKQIVAKYNGEGSWIIDGWKNIEPYYVSHVMLLPPLPDGVI